MFFLFTKIYVKSDFVHHKFILFRSFIYVTNLLIWPYLYRNVLYLSNLCLSLLVIVINNVFKRSIEVPPLAWSQLRHQWVSVVCLSWQHWRADGIKQAPV